MVSKKRSRRGKGPKRIAYNDNDKDNNNERLMENSEESNEITFEYANIDNLKDAYIEAMNEIESVELDNKQIQNIIIKNRILFTTLIILGLYAYYQPSYISGMTGEKLVTFKEQKTKLLKAEGFSDEVTESMVANYVNLVTQTRFVFGNGKPMNAKQILDYLKTIPNLKNLIISLEDICLGFQKTASNIGDIYNTVKFMLSSFTEGKIDISLTGKMISYGIWTIIMMSSYSFAKFITNIGNKVTQTFESTERMLGINKKMKTDESNLLLVEKEGKKKVLTFNEIVDVINKDKSPIVISTFDWFLCKLFEHEEAWTMDNNSETSTLKSRESIYSELSNKSLSSLESVASYGYGGDYDRLVDFMIDNFGSEMEYAKSITMSGFTNLYISLLKGYTYNSNEKQIDENQKEESQQSTQQDNMDVTFISDLTSTTGMKTINDDRIEQLTENAVKNTFRRSKYKKKLGGKIRKNRKTKKHNSKKTRKIRKGKKTMKKSYKK